MDILIKRAKQGDKDAFTKLILNIQEDLYKIAKMRLKNEDDINDVIQETMISAYKNIRKLKEDRYFKTWIIKILINKCNKKYHERYRKFISFEDNEIEKYAPGKELENHKLDFGSIISSLNKEEKNIMILYYYLEYTAKDISEILGIKEGTIFSKISRAKKKILDKYKGEME